jgi:hypothetical protein
MVARPTIQAASALAIMAASRPKVQCQPRWPIISGFGAAVTIA